MTIMLGVLLIGYLDPVFSLWTEWTSVANGGPYVTYALTPNWVITALQTELLRRQCEGDEAMQEQELVLEVVQ